MRKFIIDGTSYQLMSDIQFKGGTSDCFLLRKVGMGHALQPMFYLFKKLHRNIAKSRVYGQLLEREYRLGSCLQNTNVVGYKAYFKETEGVVINYVNGCTLEEFLRADAVKDTEHAYFGGNLCNVAKFCFQILSGLKAMHDRGFCHCDLTCDNIMMTNVTCNAVIIDLGMAHCDGDGTIIGTASHICAPEMKAGHADGRSDIYMFGLILKRIVTHLPVLEKIVEHCIAVEPECRYQSVDEVAETILNLSTTRMQSALLLSYFLTYFPQSYTMAV